MIGIDGVRSDAFELASTPNIDRLSDEGAWTLDASTQLEADTMSGPGWTSILTGVDADKHLVDGNNDLGELSEDYPGFLERAQDADLSTVLAVRWLPITALVGSAADMVVTGYDQDIADDMSGFLLEEDYVLSFIVLDDVDAAGHAGSFSPDDSDYVGAIETADAQTGELLDALQARPSFADEDWLVVVVTDHGGEGNNHGPRNEANRRIPMIFWGSRVVSGELDGEFLSHMDVHPTVMSHLGLEPSPAWDLDGNVVALSSN